MVMSQSRDLVPEQIVRLPLYHMVSVFEQPSQPRMFTAKVAKQVECLTNKLIRGGQRWETAAIATTSRQTIQTLVTLALIRARCIRP